jgi:hypothetical protein
MSLKNQVHAADFFLDSKSTNPQEESVGFMKSLARQFQVVI